MYLSPCMYSFLVSLPLIPFFDFTFPACDGVTTRRVGPATRRHYLALDRKIIA